MVKLTESGVLKRIEDRCWYVRYGSRRRFACQLASSAEGMTTMVMLPNWSVAGSDMLVSDVFRTVQDVMRTIHSESEDSTCLSVGLIDGRVLFEPLIQRQLSQQ